MKGKREKGRRLALKCLLAVIGFSFFAAQLSYKFYVYSSLPLVHSAGKAQSPGTGASGRLVSPKHVGRVFLSLDKRYDHKHIYDLYIPPSLLVFQQAGVETIVAVFCVSTSSVEQSFISTRGPPVS